MAMRIYHRVSTADVNKAVIHPAPCLLRAVQSSQTYTTAHRYIKIFDKASEPILGYDVPVLTTMSHKSVDGSLQDQFTIPGGLRMENGLALAITAGLADSDGAAIGASELVAHVIYEVL